MALEQLPGEECRQPSRLFPKARRPEAPAWEAVQELMAKALGRPGDYFLILPPQASGYEEYRKKTTTKLLPLTPNYNQLDFAGRLWVEGNK